MSIARKIAVIMQHDPKHGTALLKKYGLTKKDLPHLDAGTSSGEPSDERPSASEGAGASPEGDYFDDEPDEPHTHAKHARKKR